MKIFANIQSWPLTGEKLIWRNSIVNTRSPGTYTENSNSDWPKVCHLFLTLMQSICHVNRGLIRGRRRNCFHLIFIFVSVFISTQIQFSTHGRHAACRRRLLRLPQFHLVYFFTYARACVCIRMFTLLHRIRRKMKIFSYFFLSLRLLLVENLFNGTFSQYFDSLFPFAV